MAWRAIPGPLSKRKRRLDSLETAQGAPRLASGGRARPVDQPSGRHLASGGRARPVDSICQQIWKTQQWPQDWKRSVFIPIPQTGARPPEAKCRPDGWSTGRARPPEAKCRPDGWSTRTARGRKGELERQAEFHSSTQEEA